jgi:antitoxin (DNA-binding transcriptional repressor) of toxin-antitoxin stability system
VRELRQGLTSILDRVHRRGDSFVIEQDGEALAALEPVAGAATWSTLAAALRNAPRPDEAFGTDLQEIQRNQPDVPTNVWPS